MSPNQQLELLRPALIRFAALHLRDRAIIEDVVQDTLLAFLEKPDQFKNQSSLRTYVTGILKFKIIDALRSTKKEPSLDVREDEFEEDVVDALFNRNGHWIDKPRHWGNPEEILQEQDFFIAMERCLEILPASMARIFLMREWLGFETAEICKELGISSSNLWVILYRARIRLRECLDLNWFGQDNKAK